MSRERAERDGEETHVADEELGAGVAEGAAVWGDAGGGGLEDEGLDGIVGGRGRGGGIWLGGDGAGVEGRHGRDTGHRDPCTRLAATRLVVYAAQEPISPTRPRSTPTRHPSVRPQPPPFLSRRVTTSDVTPWERPCSLSSRHSTHPMVWASCPSINVRPLPSPSYPRARRLFAGCSENTCGCILGHPGHQSTGYVTASRSSDNLKRAPSLGPSPELPSKNKYPRRCHGSGPTECQSLNSNAYKYI